MVGNDNIVSVVVRDNCTGSFRHKIALFRLC